MGKIKLVYFFPVHHFLEVEYNDGEDKKWSKDTGISFRSYAGNRRINGVPYYGPIFYKGTNFLYEGPLNNKIAEISEEPRGKEYKVIRKNTKFAYDNEWGKDQGL